MTETRFCACGCGKSVTRDSSKAGFFNSAWFVNNAHYKRAKKPRRSQIQRVMAKMRKGIEA